MVCSVVVEPFSAHDREAVLALAPRLCAGVASWRPADGVLTAVRGWVEGSVADAVGAEGEGEEHGLFVARIGGELVGMVAVEEQQHWSGQRDAYVGELVTADGSEGQGVGRALLARAEQWAREHDLDRVTLETGAANGRARRFYERHGYRDEEVRLTRVLTSS